MLIADCNNEMHQLPAIVW